MYVEHTQCPTVADHSSDVARYEKAHRVAKAHLSPAEKTELYIQLAQVRLRVADSCCAKALEQQGKLNEAPVDLCLGKTSIHLNSNSFKTI